MPFKLKVAATSKYNLHKVKEAWLPFIYVFCGRIHAKYILRGILFVLSLCHQNPIFSQVSLLWFGNRIEMWSTMLFCSNSYITVAYQCCQLLDKNGMVWSTVIFESSQMKLQPSMNSWPHWYCQVNKILRYEIHTAPLTVWLNNYIVVKILLHYFFPLCILKSFMGCLFSLHIFPSNLIQTRMYDISWI